MSSGARRRCRCFCGGALIASTIFSLAAPARAEVFRPGTWEGKAELVFDFSSLDTTTGRSGVSSNTTRTEERLTLRNVGAYFYDPGLVKLDLGGTFGLVQGWFESESDGTSTEETRNGRLWGYDLSATILSEQPISMRLFANRTDDFFDRQLAGTSEVKTENRGVTVFGRWFYIPSQVTLRQEIQQEESVSSGIVSRFDQNRNIFRYEGQRGWVNSEMDVRYEFVDLTDEVFPTSSFKSYEGSMLFSHDFGPNLNRRWDSRLRYSDRTGASPLTNFTLDQFLRIDHTDQFETHYRYLFTKTDAEGGETTSHNGAFGLRHQLYKNLTTTFNVDGRLQTQPGGDVDIIGGRLDLDYTKRLPGDGRLDVGLGGGFEYQKNDFDDPVTSAVNELHIFSPADPTSLQLDNPFVIQSSVVVTKQATGPLPPGCNPFPVPQTLTEGVDYTLNTGGDITEIVPIPCSLTTAGINPGDTISVDYQYIVSPSLAFSTAIWHASISVDYGWIRPFFSHEQQNQTRISGRDGEFLEDVMSDTLGVDLRYESGRLRANLRGEGKHYTSDRQAYNEVRASPFLRYMILPELMLSVSANGTFTDFSIPEDRQTTNLAGQASLTYNLNSSLSARAFTGLRDFNDTLGEDEFNINTGLEVRWFFRNIEIRPTLEFSALQRGDTDTNEFRANLRIIRRF